MTATAPTPAPPDLPPDWQDADAVASYYAAIAAIGEAVRNGVPVPTTGYFGTARRGG